MSDTEDFGSKDVIDALGLISDRMEQGRGFATLMGYIERYIKSPGDSGLYWRMRALARALTLLAGDCPKRSVRTEHLQNIELAARLRRAAAEQIDKALYSDFVTQQQNQTAALDARTAALEKAWHAVSESNAEIDRSAQRLECRKNLKAIIEDPEYLLKNL